VMDLLDWINKIRWPQRGPGAVLWSDEKVFVVDQMVNKHNRRILSPKRISNSSPWPRTSPPSVMVFGLFFSNGNVMPPLFIPKVVKIKAVWYLENVIPAIEAWAESVWDKRWTSKVHLMQDEASTHTTDFSRSYVVTL
ncbi:DDE superfamily endonuclease, partial [Caligus rogercresseyi]